MTSHRLRLSLQEKEALRDAFMQMSGLSDPSARDMCVKELEAELGETLTTARFPDAHRDLWSIIRGCASHPAGLEKLVEVAAIVVGPNRHFDRVRAILARASPEATKPDQVRVRRIWGGVPLRNPDFVGREEYLAKLSRALSAETALSVAPLLLYGYSGVGKTQIVTEWVHRHATGYDLIWWVSAEQLSTIRSSFETLAARLDLPAGDDTHRTLIDALAVSPLRWLLVYDNAGRPDDLAPLVPTANGHVMVTSHNHAWATSRLGISLEVDVFRRDESTEMLRRHDRTLSADDADRLAGKLGDLPLALDQAAIWRADTGMPVHVYLERFETHARELLDVGRPAGYPATVYAVLRGALGRLRSEHPAAAHLLDFLARPPLSALSEPVVEWHAVHELRRLGLARIDPDSGAIEVHRLAQLVLREDLLDEQRRQALHHVQGSWAPRTRATRRAIGSSSSAPASPRS